LDPAYGLDIGVTVTNVNPSVFETAINEPIGAQFLASLQDLVARGIIEVLDDGTPMTPEDIRDFRVTGSATVTP
jgi:sulfur transfer complex TusBCD TusB component (DsrH family)